METTTIAKQQPLLPTLPKQSLIVAYSNLGTPNSILNNIACRSYDDVLTSNHATIGELAERNQNWYVFTLAYITAAITSYLDFVGRRNTMNDQQVGESARLILEEYPDLKMDDIALFFRQCKLSHFGKLYDLNGAVLIEWLNQYQKERSTAYWQLQDRLEREQREEQERKEKAEWEALTPEQQAQRQREIEQIQERIANRLRNLKK